MTKFYNHDTAGQEREDWEKVCPIGEYRVVPPQGLSGLMPAGLLAKADSILVVASGSPRGKVMYMANVNRVDAKASGVDQTPMAVVFFGTTPAMSGCFAQHGSWSRRTTREPPEFWEALASGNLGQCYPINHLPVKMAGTISELNVPSQHAAFETLADKLKEMLTSGR
jgi:hypothetical protein